MKTYILRDPKAVEPQKAQLVQPGHPPIRPLPPADDPAADALVEQILAAGKGPALYIGLDVHNDSIAVSLAPSDSSEVRRYGIIGGCHDDVLKLIKKLTAAHPSLPLKFCYEAGPRGYPLCRFMSEHGVACIIVAPSRVPRKPGEIGRAHV